jgi:ubiquinone/menaquinone biosynthesis C-methylase UbiE
MSALEDFLAGLKAAAEPTRLRLVVLLSQGELTVTELTEILGQSQPRVSRHLKLMVEAGLLERVKEGTWAFYRLARGEPAAQLVRTLLSLLPAEDSGLKLDHVRLARVKKTRAEAAAAYFRRNAKDWDEIRRLYADEREVETALSRAAGTDRRIGEFLDIGTGTGKILALFGPTIGHGVGIDQSREMLALARTNLEAAGLANCEVRLGDMYNLPLADRSVDAAVLHQVLHYADDPVAAIREAARVLRPGGRLMIADFAPHELEYLREDHAHRRLGFADSDVDSWLIAAGLVPSSPIRVSGAPLTVVVWIGDLPQVARERAPRSEASAS